MTDLVERLKTQASRRAKGNEGATVEWQAAARISQLEAELIAAHNAAIEAAANVVAGYSEHVSSLDNKRYLRKRTDGDLMATAYATYILSLKRK